MKRVNIGLVGSGFCAALHAQAYRMVSGMEAHIGAVCSLDAGRLDFAREYGIERHTDDFVSLLDDSSIDVIDICTPPMLHVDMVSAALQASKHVICEKPLTGYFGGDGFNANTGKVSRREMLAGVITEMDALKVVVDACDRQFFYAENFVYAPAVQKCLDFLRARRSKILYMRGEESHSGSHAAHAAHWKYNGGGSLIRQGCHPLSALLYLKAEEARLRGEPYGVRSVVADVGVTQACLTGDERRHIDSSPVDVEDMANVVLTFLDGTKALITSGDMIMGGVRNLVEVFTNDGAYIGNLAPNDTMVVYHPDEERLQDVYITEKIGNKSGWQHVYLGEEIARGYVGELQDFMGCVIGNDAPQAGFDLAYETTRVLYAAYCAAEEGVRFDF
ncbi:Gfo/Idh/MocA family oxidoreductase [Eubacteriales bacterium OttesenSCG-928-A19]|nr:Gfo/Idh/MocA family oxidoreductase [Eubacteriales bacterium OttesenSCG-928-A19]